MEFEWDEKKRLFNIEKHGIDFLQVTQIFNSLYVEENLLYREESRWRAIGIINDIEITVIYTKRKEAIRIISARRLSKNERKKFQEISQKRNRTNDR
jgi:hypothetical protein